MTDNNDVVKHDNLACEALDSFFFKSTFAEFVVDPYSYHAFILSQHKLHSVDVSTDDLALPNCRPHSSVFYTEWKNEVDKNIPVESLSQSLPLKLLNKGDVALIEDIDVEDIDLSATMVEPEKQVSLSLFGPNAVKVDNFVDDDDNSHGGEGYIPSGVQLESSLESATDYLLQQFERDLLADGSDDDEEFDECRNNKTAEYMLNTGNVPNATIHENNSSGGDYPEKFDCESSIDSGICTIDCGDDNNSDYDDDDDDDYQGPSLLPDEQLLASTMQSSSCGDGDLIRFLTSHGGRLHGLYDRLPAIPHATEDNGETVLDHESDEVVPF